MRYAKLTERSPDYAWIDPSKDREEAIGDGEITQAWVVPGGLLISEGLGAVILLVTFTGDLGNMAFQPSE